MKRPLATRSVRRTLLGVLLCAVLALGMRCHEEPGYQLFASPQADPIALSPDGSTLYVVCTTCGVLRIIDTGTLDVIRNVAVGIDPVGLAVRPDGKEVWVANHISDSVSVVDTDPASDTFHTVVETIQDVDGNLVTQFDEPVGVAFASNTKAYVALSSTNQVAVVDATTYQVASSLDITAQDPRALTVRGGLLYVAAFESGNQSELSACPNGVGSAPQCTVDEGDLQDFITNPNIPNAVKNIVIDPDLPDRDLFVFDTSTDSLVEAVTGVGTLLYGVAVDSTGRAWVSQTDARNAENGLDGEFLKDLQHRIFDNQLAEVSCTGGGCGSPTVHELDPTVGTPPVAGTQLATPYGIRVSDDDSTLVVTAAASSRLFTFDTGTQTVVGRVDVGAIPRGVALHSHAGTGAPLTAYVLNTLDNSLSVVDVSTPASPVVTNTVSLGSDPTPENVRLGRIAFNDATASTEGTFSCASCHPDGNVDQILWRIGGDCPGCSGHEPRSTMPVRGLKNTLPLHWDGTLGDPFGGPNGAGGSGSNCTDDQSCFLQLVGASLSGVMCRQTAGNACENTTGELGATERDNMATFLASVVYPPARARRPDDSFSTTARDGIRDFFTDQGGLGNAANVSTCGDSDSGCHALPLGTSSAGIPGVTSVVGNFDAPTMRGMTDRFLQFSLGVSNPEEIMTDQTAWTNALALDEFTVFSVAFPQAFTVIYNVPPDNIFQMFEESSTGFSGAAGRQVTLNASTTSGGSLAETESILSALEAADAKGVVNLRGAGLRDTGGGLAHVTFSYHDDTDTYETLSATASRAQLISDAQAGDLVITFTAFLPRGVDDLSISSQPLLAPDTLGGNALGNPAIPIISASGASNITLEGIDVAEGAAVFVDGQKIGGAGVTCQSGGSFTPFCSSEVVQVSLPTGPGNGLHRLQVQNPAGLLSNEMPICGGNANQCD